MDQNQNATLQFLRELREQARQYSYFYGMEDAGAWARDIIDGIDKVAPELAETPSPEPTPVVMVFKP